MGQMAPGQRAISAIWYRRAWVQGGRATREMARALYRTDV